jgi:hypothetical protein
VNDPTAMIQGTLDDTVKTMKRGKEFTREGVLHTVSQFVACDDQVGFEKCLRDSTDSVVRL